MVIETPLRRIRKQRGLTVEQLAVKAGHGSATVYRAERGEQNPTDDTWAALAAVLGVEVDSLRHAPEAANASTGPAGDSPDAANNPAPADAGTRLTAGA